MKKTIIICDMPIMPDIPDICDMPGTSEDVAVAEDVAMPLMSMEVEDAIAMVLVAIFMLLAVAPRVDVAR